MGFRSFFKRTFAKKKEAPLSSVSDRSAEQAIINRSAIQSGRKAIEVSTRASQGNIVPRQFIEYHGRDLTSLINMSSKDLLNLLFTIDPTASHALSNFLRVFDSGYYAVARDFENQPEERAQKFLNTLLLRYDRPTGPGFAGDTSIDSFYCRAVTQALFHGAVAVEIEFDPSLYNVGIHLVDPLKIEFQEEEGTERLIPTFTSGRDKVPLDFKNFLYFPVDPLPGDPYGTSQFISAITPIMSKVRLLQDFARALRNLGFDRIDITVDEEALIDACKKRGIKDAAKIEEVINRVVENTRDSFSNLEVDDNPAHLSSIKLSALEGKNAGRQLDIKAIVDVMMSDIASGLKTFATILGKAFNRSSEGYQSIEALLYIKMVEGFQVFIERVMERALTVILQVEGGYQAYVDFEFLEPSIRPVYESAQYFATFQNMVYQAEKLGHIGAAEGSRLIRRMLALRGDPPPDAQRDDSFSPETPSSPQRDRSQESDKENRRARTRNERRSSPSG